MYALAVQKNSELRFMCFINWCGFQISWHVILTEKNGRQSNP